MNGGKMAKSAHLAWAAFAALSLTSIGCVTAAEGTDEGTSSRADAVVGGKTADIANWTGVVAVGSEMGGSCTGTLISPRHVLTAAHCTAAGGQPGDKDPTRIYFGDSVLSANSKHIAVTKVDAYGSGFDEKVDIAILTLAEDAPFAPIPLATDCGAATDGGDVKLVGYGVSDNADFGTLHQIDLKVGILACNDISLSCPSSGNGANIVTMPSGMCGGDSGGPLFVVNEHGKFVAGVVSGPTQDEMSDMCPDWKRAMYGRPDSIIGWVESKVGAALAKPNCSGGAGGSAGSAGSGGSSGSAGSSGSGAGGSGAAGSGGSSGSAGSAGSATSSPAPADDGCSLAVGKKRDNAALFVMGLVGVAFAAARRRRRS